MNPKVRNSSFGETGGAFGFDSETSAGPDITTIDSLNRMLSLAERTLLNFKATQFRGNQRGYE